MHTHAHTHTHMHACMHSPAKNNEPLHPTCSSWLLVSWLFQVCALCDDPEKAVEGVHTSCAYPTCKSTIHQSCAQANGLTNQPIYCNRHADTTLARSRVSNVEHSCCAFVLNPCVSTPPSQRRCVAVCMFSFHQANSFLLCTKQCAVANTNALTTVSAHAPHMHAVLCCVVLCMSLSVLCSVLCVVLCVVCCVVCMSWCVVCVVTCAHSDRCAHCTVFAHSTQPGGEAGL